MLKRPISNFFSFKSLYVAFFIAVVFYGQLRLMYGLTPRHIAIFVMLFACTLQGVPFPMGRIMKTYFVFILAYLVSAAITGYIGNVLIMYYIGACVGFWATMILGVKYHDGRLLLNLLIVLGIINALVTIGQTFNMSFPDKLIDFLRLRLPQKYVDRMNVEGSEDMALLLTRPGMFLSSVYNGYFSMTAGVASMMLVARKWRIHRFIPWAIISFGCFCVQERGPIIILMLLSALAFYKVRIIRKLKYALLFLLTVFIVHSIAGSIDSILSISETNRMETYWSFTTDDYEDESESKILSNYSRFVKESRFAKSGINDSGRENIYRLTISYIIDHPIIGGSDRLHALYGIYPHNLFLLAFCYGGIVGGFAIILILFWQAKLLWRVLRRKVGETDPVCFFTALAYIAFTLNSMVHNRSIVTGDEVIWMLWGLFYFEYIKFSTRTVKKAGHLKTKNRFSRLFSNKYIKDSKNSVHSLYNDRRRPGNRIQGCFYKRDTRF